MARGNEVVVKFLGDDTRFKKTLGSVKRGLGGLARSAGIAGAAIAGAGVALAAVSLKAFGNFEDKLNQSFAIMGGLTDTLKEQMSDTAREIGKTTRISASDAAESYFFLASAGFTAEQSIAALPQVAAFAQAGMFDMATATDLATDAQSALGLKSDDAQKNLGNLTRVTDVLVKANTLANASTEQFSTALTTKAGAALKILGKDMEEGVAVLAAFADQGIKGELAGTQLGIVLRDLTTKGIKFKDKFEKAGVGVFDASGEMNNMADIIGDLEGALGGLSDEAQKKLLLDLGFSDKSLASLQALLGTSEDIRTYEASLREAGDTTQTVADKQLESFKGQLSLVKGRLEDVAIEIGSRLAPIALRAFDEIGSWWDRNGPGISAAISTAFSAIGEWWNKNGGTVKKIAKGYVDFVIGVYKVLFPFLAKIFQGLWDWWQENGPRVIEIAKSVFFFILNEVIRPVVDKIIELWPRIVEIIKNVISTIQIIWEKWGGDFKQLVKEVVDALKPFFEGVVSVIEGVVNIIKGIITGDWALIWEGFKQVVKGAIKIVEGIIKAMIAWYKFKLKIIGDILHGLIDTPWAATRDFVKKAITATINFFKKMPGRVTSALSTVANKMKQPFIDGFNAVKKKVEGVKGAVFTALNKVPGKIKNAAIAIKNAMGDLGRDMLDGLKGAITGAASFAGNIASGVARAVKNAINTGVIDKINRGLEFTIPIPFAPDIDINPPDIPRLARGGVTGINDPFLAVVGDNTSSREIITPEDLMRKIVREELGNNGGGDSPTVVIEEINMESTADARDVADEIMWSLRGVGMVSR